ncbi:hypothetical protein PoB_006942300 [Plakobranchus ocellatus]|uniref:Uncharacterized protein n=1 Tax=Plakobranchus ocellatus TaxID=259542 RepID=A0AAV4DF67_9GAST|nr:hypothetical protein PoB_006942300 [Plakobranchus ocellatus]
MQRIQQQQGNIFPRVTDSAILKCCEKLFFSSQKDSSDVKLNRPTYIEIQNHVRDNRISDPGRKQGLRLQGILGEIMSMLVDTVEVPVGNRASTLPQTPLQPRQQLSSSTLTKTGCP